MTYGTDKLQDPHEFETEFGRVLNGLKYPRLLVIFDNLDRVTHDKALEVLSTIKTFLEPKDTENKKKEVVFLIPCDAPAIKSHVASVYKTEPNYAAFDPDEFLRKFFNTIIWIPDFIPSELESFARNMLKKTKAKDLDDDKVAWIITKAFRENPRQVVQFTNILLANYLLVKEREKGGDLPKDFAKTNIAQLAKYLILSELFPGEMDELRNNKISNLAEVKISDLTTKHKDLFMKFRGETPDIPIENLRIFFSLRHSDHEKSFSGIDSFITLLEDKKIEDARKYFEKLDFSKPEKIDDFSQVIKDELGNKTNPVSAVNLIGSLLTLLDEKKIFLNPTAYTEINNKLSGVGLKFIHFIDPAILDRQLLVPHPDYRQAIVTQWIESIEDDLSHKTNYQLTEGFIKSVFGVFAEHNNYLDSALLEKVQAILTTHLTANIEIAEIVTKDADRQKRFVSPEYIRASLSRYLREP